MQNLLIGTSGYDYPEWKGVFYPRDLKRKDFLPFYATQFNALELNNTFYSMPTSQRMENFITRSDEKINFSVKANKLLTHDISRSWKDDAETFRNAINPMKEKDLLCSVLFQFPQSFHYTVENRIYLAKLIEEFPNFPVVIEFRHREWLKESVFVGLAERNASIAFCDMPILKYLPNADFEHSLYSQVTGPISYLRLHGRNAQNWYENENQNTQNGSARYDYSYSDEELQKFVPIIHMIKNAGKYAMAFFNNHPKGSGALNAKKLCEMVKS